jgi:hypothetical protein
MREFQRNEQESFCWLGNWNNGSSKYNKLIKIDVPVNQTTVHHHDGRDINLCTWYMVS